MTTDSGLSPTDPRVETVSQFFRRVGKGWRTMSRDKRSFMSRNNAKRRWELRRLRYGATGSKPNNYAAWLADRGYPPANQP